MSKSKRRDGAEGVVQVSGSLSRPSRSALPLAVGMGIAALAAAKPGKASGYGSYVRRGYSPRRHEFVFVDPRVPDHEVLLAAARPGLRVIVLDPARDGLAQISETLAATETVDAVHLVAHGSPGRLELAASELDTALLEAHRDDLIRWFARRNAARTPAEVLVYGCETAKGAVGAAFVDTLARLTGAEVAASTDVTGGSAAGGDWTLEHALGRIDSAIAFDTAAAEAYRGALATFTVLNADDSGPGSFRQAVIDANAAAGPDTIEFDATAFATDTTITLQSTVGINDDLVVDGPDAARVTISGDGFVGSLIRTYSETGAIAVTLQDLTFANANNVYSYVLGKRTRDCGGAVRSAGTDLTLINDDFLYNDAGSGGAVCFTDNSLNPDASLVIDNSRFRYNTANPTYGQGNGGAIYIGSYYSTTDAPTRLEIRNDSRFLGNFAAGHGGAIRARGLGDISISGSLFERNVAQTVVSYSEPYSYYAPTYYVYVGRGGGLSSSGTASVSIEASRFVLNRAGEHGGGADIIGSYDEADPPANPTTITDTYFAGNTTRYDGGGLRQITGTLSVTGGAVVDGRAEDGGGLFLDQLQTLSITGTAFRRNEAIESGGGVHLRTDIYVYANYVNGVATQATITDAAFTDNRADTDGGGAIASYIDQSPLTISGSTFSGNDAGGALIPCDVVEGPYGSYQPDRHGGALRLEAGDSVAITDSTFDANVASCRGGAIMVDDVGDVSLTGLTVTGNAATDGGGAFFYQDAIGPEGVYESAVITLGDSTFDGNTASRDGGAIHFYDTDGATITITGTTLSANTADEEGGGVFVQPGNFQTFAARRAKAGPDVVSLVNSTISGNTAVSGAGIKHDDGESALELINVTVAANTATDAAAGVGGVWLAFGSGHSIRNTLLADNVGRVSGADLEVGEAGGSMDFSLVENPGTPLPGFTFGANVITAQDPVLAPLADNGGPTQTHLPQFGSPVLNVGDNTAVPAGVTTDQRGAGFDRILETTVDLGAVETIPVFPEFNAVPAAPGPIDIVGPLGVATTVQVVVDNLGTANLEVTPSGLSGILGVAPTGLQILGPDGDATDTLAFEVTCTPTALGAAPSQTLNFATNDTTDGEASVDFTVNCIGQEPDVTVAPASPQTLTVPIGSSADLVITLGNVGNVDLSVDASALTGPLAISDAGIIRTVAPSGSIDYTVTCAPTAPGTSTQTISFDTNDPDEDPVAFEVSCVALVPDIDTVPAAPGPLVLSSTVGAPVQQIVTVSNVGTAPLTVDPIDLAGVIAVAPTGLVTLDPGASQDFTVTCTPAAPGQAQATLGFDTNDPDEDPVDFDITCTTLSPEFDATPAAPGPIALSTPVGVTATAPLTIANLGTADLTVDASGLVGVLGIAPDTLQSIAPNGSLPLTISCTPTAGSTTTQTLSFDTNDADEDPVTFTVNCIGLAPEFDANPPAGASLSLLVPPGGTSTSGTITVGNLGSADLTVAASGLSGALSILPAGSQTIAPDGSLGFVVTCNQAAPGTTTQTLTFTTNDADENPVTLTVNCQTLAAAVPVPTGGDGGRMALIALLAGLGLIALRRRPRWAAPLMLGVVLAAPATRGVAAAEEGAAASGAAEARDQRPAIRAKRERLAGHPLRVEHRDAVAEQRARVEARRAARRAAAGLPAETPAAGAGKAKGTTAVTVERSVTRVTGIERKGDRVLLALADGRTLDVAANALRLPDGRRAAPRPRANGPSAAAPDLARLLPRGMPYRVVVRRDAAGAVLRVVLREVERKDRQRKRAVADQAGDSKAGTARGAGEAGPGVRGSADSARGPDAD